MVRVTLVRLSDELVARLDLVAASTGRSRSWVIEQAVARYLDEDAWQVGAIREALAAYERGDAETWSHDEVVAHVDAFIRARAGDQFPSAGPGWL